VTEDPKTIMIKTIIIIIIIIIIISPKADVDILYVKKERKRSDLLQKEATYKGEIIKTPEYLKTKYTEVRIVNIVNSKNQS